MKKALSIFAVLLSLLACRQPVTQKNANESEDFKKAENFWSEQQVDSAFFYFNTVATVSKDSLEIATAYNYMASIQSDAGDYYGAQESLISSLKYLNESRKEHRACLASDYNELGMTSSSLQNYDNANNYFDLALRFSDNEDYRRIFLNNKANAYRDTKAYGKALSLYKQIIRKVDPAGKEYARFLTNMANTRWRQDSAYRAAPELLKALRIREKLNDLKGQNSSYAHLAEYYFRITPDSGLYYSGKMLEVSRQIKNSNDELHALKMLIKLSPNSTLKQYFERYEHLSDSLQTARSAAKNQFALIRYHAEKNKADNLRLQKENAEHKYDLIKQRVRFYGLAAIFVLSAFLAYLWYSRRKVRLEREKEEAIKETQRKASKTVHDTLANDIYRIMKTVQYGFQNDPDWLIDNLDDVYQRARDLSYDIIKNVEHFEQSISMLLKSFSSDGTRVNIIGNKEELWNKLSATAKIEIRYILQELMVNMEKHSSAKNVVVKFREENDHGFLTYIDDGIGIKKGTDFSIGLTSTGTRIKSIGGQLNFDNDVNEGFQINITFPLI